MGVVSLAPLGHSHADAMLRWTSDAEIRDNLGLRTTASREGTEAWLNRALADETVRAFAICRDGEHIGNVVLDRIDRHLGTARLHIYIGEAAARGHGVGARATALAVEHAFTELGLHKVWLTVHAKNGRAIAAYARAGFQVEGVLRDEFIFRGERVAAVYMGRLRADRVP
jgi:RimJ/RimL family protein N-acetyltransferase